MSRFSAAALAVTLFVFALSSGGCGTSVESHKKAARSNADKYYELLKAGNPEQAYRETFSDTYKLQLPIESFLKYQQLYTSRYGPVVDYSVTDSTYDAEREMIVMTYSINTSTSPTPLADIVRLGRVGSEWRIVSVEPKNLRPQSQQPQPPAGSAQPPAGAPPAAPPR
jgi:hypothetical protein